MIKKFRNMTRKMTQSLIDFVVKIAALGYQKAMAEADAETLRQLKLDRINNHQRGRGRRSFVVIHNRIRNLRIAHFERAKLGRWVPERSPWSGLLDPEYHQRMVARRQRRYARALVSKTAWGGNNLPRHIREHANG